MAAFADLERLLERLFERTSARVFRSGVQAVHVERRVERAMEAGRTGRGASTMVPAGYRVRLNPADLDDLATRSGGPEALAVRLADRALAFARLHAYHLTARPTVHLVADPTVERGRVDVDAVTRSPGASDPGAPVQGWAAPPEVVAAMPPPVAPVAAGHAPGVAPAPAGPVPAPAAMSPVPDVMLPAAAPEPAAAPGLVSATPAPGLRGDGERRMPIRPATAPPPRALLRLSEPGRKEREVRVEGVPLTLGRAPDNGLVITDQRVSRHHGRFVCRHGTLVYTDLGSTNGTRVNGIRVDEIVLGAGDRLQLGDVVVVVEQLPG